MRTPPLVRQVPLFLSLLLLSGCLTVPETGRRQVMLISSSQEMQLGLSAFQQIFAHKAELPVCQILT